MVLPTMSASAACWSQPLSVSARVEVKMYLLTALKVCLVGQTGIHGPAYRSAGLHFFGTIECAAYASWLAGCAADQCRAAAAA